VTTAIPTVIPDFAPVRKSDNANPAVAVPHDIEVWPIERRAVIGFDDMKSDHQLGCEAVSAMAVLTEAVVDWLRNIREERDNQPPSDLKIGKILRVFDYRVCSTVYYARRDDNEREQPTEGSL
jgi:hypothetical protein